MLDPGDGSRLELEPADEVRPVGQFGSEDLDGHVAFDPRLDRAMDDREGALADAFADLVAPQGLDATVEARVTAGDPPLQVDDLLGRIEPCLVGEVSPVRGVHTQRFGLAPVGVHRPHQQHSGPLAQRLGLDERGGLGGRLVVQSVHQACLDQRFARLHESLVEPNTFRSSPLLVGESGVGRPVPASDRPVEDPASGRRVSGAQIVQPEIELLFEDGTVEFSDRQIDDVAGLAEHNSPLLRTEGTPQACDVAAQGCVSAVGRLAVPHDLHQAFGRNDRSVRHRQGGEQPSQPCSHLDLISVAAYADRTEDRHLHVHHPLSAHAPSVPSASCICVAR